MHILEGLQPEKVFTYFEEICQIPHGSGNEKQISAYLTAFARAHGLSFVTDSADNVVIKKEAAAGYAGSIGVILQGHVDMVCEKNKDTQHDFLTDPLKLYVDGDFIKANGTTLGADNGIAVAFMLALLEDSTLPHPALECIFTTDEEVGMKGAHALDCTSLTGRRFINMDTEEEGAILASCCGGMRVNLCIPAKREAAPKEYTPMLLRIQGLKGGHSGADIGLQRANANKLLGRALEELSKSISFCLSAVSGGLMDNAIPREAEAVLLLAQTEAAGAQRMIYNLQEVLRYEHRKSDADILMTLTPLAEKVDTVLTQKTSQAVIDALSLIPYGVLSMSPDLTDLVESSNNPGVLKTTPKSILICSALRSASGTKKVRLYENLQTIARLVGASCESTSAYPSWEYNPESELLQICQKVYQEKHSKKAEIKAIHAGLECGLFSQKIPGLDLISIGPNLFDAHTPNERLSISSTQATWEYLLAILKNLK